MLEDAGLALFTGSSTVLCSTSLHSFDYDMKEATLREMKTIYIEILKKASGEIKKFFDMVEEVEHIEDWEVVRIKRAKGGYANIRAHEKRVTLRYKDDDEKWKKLEMREVIVTDNGRGKPMFIITPSINFNAHLLVLQKFH